jgi:hypothetical protein
MKVIWALIVITAITVIVYFWYSVFRSTRDSNGGPTTVSSTDAGADRLMAGNSVNVGTPVEGDLAIAGSAVTVAESVEGYVLAAGSNVSINGGVGNDLWAAGSNVSVNGVVADNAWLAGSSVVLQPQGSVGGNAYLAGNQVEVLGPVQRDLKVGAANIKLGSEIGGSVMANAGSVNLLPGALIRGDLTVTGPHAPQISEGAQVLGRVVHNTESRGAGWRFLNWLMWWMCIFLAVLILGAVTIVLSTQWVNRISEKVRHRFGYSLLAGIIGLIVVPLVCVLLALTIIGIPLAFVLFALYCIALALSCVFVSYVVGGWLLGRLRRTDTSPYVRLAAGALVVAFFVSLPWVGWIVQLFVLVIGLGALILERKDSRSQVLIPSAA